MRECGGDLGRLGDHLRAGEARWADEGHTVVSFAGQPPLAYLVIHAFTAITVLGADTEDVLRELGVDAADFSRLREAKVI